MRFLRILGRVFWGGRYHHRVLLWLGFVVVVGGSLVAFGNPPITCAQAELPQVGLSFVTGGCGKFDFSVEVAKTERQQETGEMFRPSIPANGGMVFPLGSARVISIWTVNCPVPEDVVFVGKGGVVEKVVVNVPAESKAIVSSGGPVVAIVELRAGTVGRIGLERGDSVGSAVLQGA